MDIKTILPFDGDLAPIAGDGETNQIEAVYKHM